MKSVLRVVYDGPSHASELMHMGAHMKAIRIDREITQERAAVRAGLTRNTLARHEANALPDLKLSTMLALIELYGLSSLDDLVGSPPAQELLRSWRAAGRPGLRGEFLG